MNNNSEWIGIYYNSTTIVDLTNPEPVVKVVEKDVRYTISTPYIGPNYAETYTTDNGIIFNKGNTYKILKSPEIIPPQLPHIANWHGIRL